MHAITTDRTAMRNALRPGRTYDVLTHTAQFKGVLIGLKTDLFNRHTAQFKRLDNNDRLDLPLGDVVTIQRSDHHPEAFPI